jgi:hypothetical protein
MAKRSIEETFKTIAPSRLRGVPNPATISGAFTAGGDSGSSMSEATNEISQLRTAYQQQALLITANTQALQSNTSSQSSHSVAGTVGNVASSFLGGSLGFLSPIVSGIMSLFGGGGSTQPALTTYTAPPPIAIDGFLKPLSSGSAQSASQTGSTAATAAPTQVTVQVNAMDSQSFMDRSSDIANAVREAMLNLHPINDVISNL